TSGRSCSASSRASAPPEARPTTSSPWVDRSREAEAMNASLSSTMRQRRATRRRFPEAAGRRNAASCTLDSAASGPGVRPLAPETRATPPGNVRAATRFEGIAKGAEMTYANVAPGLVRELARRTNGGIEVALFWDVTSGELTVCVADEPSN